MNPQVPDRTLLAAWKLLDAEREATKRLTAENAALRAQLEAALPDDFSESKDWKDSGQIERIAWLKDMFKARGGEVDLLLSQLEAGKA